MPFAFYALLFFVSGISGLVYEAVWTRYLKLFLGHAAYSQTLVLVIYMGGMALGAWIAARHCTRVRRPLVVFGLIEIVLGGAALLFHPLFTTFVDVSFATIIPALSDTPLLQFYKWTSAGALILPQSVLLGATFPLMAGGMQRIFPTTSGYRLAMVYFVNTLGASLGVLAAGFVLVERWGLSGAMAAAGVLDIAVGCALLALRHDAGAAGSTEEPPLTVPLPPSPPAATPFTDDDTGEQDYYRPLLWLSALTAAASFMYEIGWIRMLSLVLGSSTHAFELMLSAFILGLALGSFFIRNRVDTIRNIPRALAIIQVAMGVSALLTLYLYAGTFELMTFFMTALSRTDQGYALFTVFSHLICLLIMLPSTICAGMILPLVVHQLQRAGHGEQAIGKVYAVNTLGGIVGAIAAVWLLMPLLGLHMLLCIGGGIDIALGLFLPTRFREMTFSRVKPALLPLCALFLGGTLLFFRLDPVLMSSGVFRYGTVYPHKTIISHTDGRTASVTLYRSSGNLVLSTNGKPDAAIDVEGGICGDEYTMALLGVLPMATMPRVGTAAVIGMGAGMTSHFLLYDTATTRVDVIEIEPAMARAARMMGEKVANTFTDPRCRIVYEDAKTFFSGTTQKYDIIISEPSNPWVSGVSGLFSREFFSSIRSSLAPEGILVQWFHLYESDISIVASILKALRESFPRFEIYGAGSDYIIVASPDAQADLSIKRDVFALPGLRESMFMQGFESPKDLVLLRRGCERIVGPLLDATPYPANSDYYPFVDLHAVRYRFLGTSVGEIDELRSFVVPIAALGLGDTIIDHRITSRLLPDLAGLRAIAEAQSIYAALVDSSVGGNTAHAATFILDCARAAPGTVTYGQARDAIASLLENTLPWLTPSQSTRMWQAVKKRTAHLSRTPTEGLWLDFFEALCSHDRDGMHLLARELLPRGMITDDYSNTVLLAALLLATRTGEQYTVTRAAWNRYERNDAPPLVLQVAHALLQKPVPEP